MPVLKNSRHERFCQEVAAGHSNRSAYEGAGYSATGAAADSCATKLLRNAAVAARIAELKTQAANASSIAAARVIDEMGRLATANILDFVKIGPDGVPRVDFSTMTREQAAALVEITVDEFTDGRGDDARPVRRVRFKMADKLQAMVHLGRHLGLFKNPVQLSGAVQVETKPQSDLDAARRIAWLLHAATEGGPMPVTLTAPGTSEAA